MQKRLMAMALAAAFPHPQDEATESAPASAPSAPPAPAPTKAPKAKPKAKKAAPAKKPAKKASGKGGKNKGVSGPAVLKQYAPQYVKGGKKGDEKTAGGNKTIDCGDKLADRLRGKDLEAVYTEAAKVLNTALEEGDDAVTVKSLKGKYGKLNVGMQRMNLGNRMRAILFPRAGK